MNFMLWHSTLALVIVCNLSCCWEMLVIQDDRAAPESDLSSW